MSDAQSTEQSRGASALGRCLCTGVRFEVCGPLRPIVYCHCTLCRRASGHFAAATACAPEKLRLISAESLRWYPSSEGAQRGFCGTCGSQLFWKPAHGRHISIWAGALDSPTGLGSATHIFLADKGDYYEITDGLPQWPQWPQPTQSSSPRR